MVTKRQLISQSAKLDRFVFNKANYAARFITRTKNETAQAQQRNYLVGPALFSFAPKTEIASLPTLVLFYVSFKLYQNKKLLLTKKNVVATLSRLKLATLRAVPAFSNGSALLKNSTSDLQTFQTLNDYFFAPSFYTSINKKSR